MSEPIKPARLAETIADHLQALILEGVLRPGDRLLPERELADRLQVSRPSLREGIDLLERKGLLTGGRGGTHVARFLAPLSDPLAALFTQNERVAADYFECRTIMEVEATRLAAHRATEPDRAAIREQVERIRAAHLLDDPAAEAQADIDLHQKIYEASHNVVLLHLMRAMSDLLRRGIFYSREQLYRRPGVREASLAQHVAIGEAVLAGDGEAAEKAARDHLRFTFDTVEEIRRDDLRRAVSIRRVDRNDLIAG